MIKKSLTRNLIKRKDDFVTEPILIFPKEEEIISTKEIIKINGEKKVRFAKFKRFFGSCVD